MDDYIEQSIAFMIRKLVNMKYKEKNLVTKYLSRFIM